MIVRISILDTIINLYKPRIPGNCIKFVSKLQFLTFRGGVKIKKELSLRDLALSLCCLGRTRTLTKSARNSRATVTPQGNLFCFCAAKLQPFFEPAKCFGNFFCEIFGM